MIQIFTLWKVDIALDKKEIIIIFVESLVRIEDEAFIGTGTIILKGTHIGRGSIIGAGSIVCGEIPPFEIWAGAPARFVKKID